MAKEILIAGLLFSITFGLVINFYEVKEDSPNETFKKVTQNIHLNNSNEESEAGTHGVSHQKDNGESFETKKRSNSLFNCSGSNCPSNETLDLINLSFGNDAKTVSDAQNNYEVAIQRINESPESHFDGISKALKLLSKKDDGTRLHLINLAMQSSANKNLKIDFIKDYLTYVDLDAKNGILNENSESATVGLDFIGRVIENEDDYNEIKLSIESIEDENVKNYLLKKLEIYNF